MIPSDRFGKFLLLEETGHSILGPEYRAARLGPTGLERIVRLVKLSRTVAADAPGVRGLMDQLRYAARLDHSGIVRTLGIGRVDGSYYVCYELVEGQSLTQVLERCRARGRLLPMELALFVATKVCAALHYAHARKTESGRRYIHGLLTPSNVMLSYSGGVCLRGFGLWKSGLRAAAIGGPDSRYLAPEQLAGGVEDPRMDLFALGAILFEALTGRALVRRWRSQDIELQVAQARLASAPTEPLPPPVTSVLYRALAEAPTKRFPEAHEMRQAVETFLLARGAVLTPGDLSTLMNELFADEIAREARVLAAELEAAYEPYVEPAGGPPAESELAAAREERAAPAPPPAPEPVAEAAGEPLADAAAEPAAEAAPPAPGPPAQAAYAVYVRPAPEPSARWRWRQGVAAAVLLVALGGGAAAYRLAPGTGPRAGAAAPDATAQKVAALEKQLASLQAERAEAAAGSEAEGGASPAAVEAGMVAPPEAAPLADPGASMAIVPAMPAEVRPPPPAAIVPAPRAAGVPTRRELVAPLIDQSLGAAGPPSGLVAARPIEAPFEGRNRPVPAEDDSVQPVFLEAPPGFEEEEIPAEPVLIDPPPSLVSDSPVVAGPRLTQPMSAPPQAPPAAPVRPPPVRPQPARSQPAVAPPAAVQPAAQQAVVDLLRRYEAAIKAKDMAALKSIWPGMGRAEEEKIRQSFGFARSLTVEIRPGDVRVAGESATLTGQRRDELVTVEGERLRSESAATFRFRNQQGRWVIEAIR